MEYDKSQVYSIAAWDYTVTSSQRNSTDEPSWWDPDNDIPPFLPPDCENYTVTAKAEDFDADNDGNIEVPGKDEGIQKITVNIYHPDTDPDPVIILEDYKVER